MNINPETDLDLEKLFLPAWAQESANNPNRYAKFTGNEGAGREDRGERRGPRPPRREGGFGGGGGSRGPGGPGQGRRPEGAGPRGPRRDGPRPQGQESRGGFSRDDRRGPREPMERREPVQPLPEVVASIIPDEKGVESMARQVKMTGRAFPLFDIAFLVIQKPERYAIRFATKKNPQGQVIQPLFHCALDETIWLSEDEAVAHVLQKHFATFYQADKIQAEAPKGVYTFVGQCGLSGVILGPPNYHDYQTKLRKLHAERFARMPFEVYKSRVKIVRDEAVVKQWVEEQSWKTEFTCLNVPEPMKLASREDVEKHFRATHKETIIKTVESYVLGGMAARSLRGGLGRVVQTLLAEQRRFPMQIATSLSQAFAHHGLQFFKVNKTVTHVAVARPHYLDLETTPVSSGVKRIVEFINATPKSNRRKLIEALAPSPAAPTIIPVAPVEGEAPAPAPAAPAPTAEQTALISDLHWLVHQGHVIEFANGQLDTAKKPVPKPPKPAAKSPVAATEPAATVSAEIAATPQAEASAAESAPVATVEGEGAPAVPETLSTPTDVPPAAS
ncbi:MAG: hypothetical protein QM813_06760 [Verrucomicrobiota bacterium]